MYRLTSSVLCLFFIFLFLRDSSAYAPEGSPMHGNKLTVSGENVVPPTKELISEAPMITEEALREKKLEKEVNGEEKEAIHYARKIQENGEMKTLNDDKYTLNSDNSNYNTPKKQIDVASLLVFSIDYPGAKVHPPQHNLDPDDYNIGV